MQALIHQIGRSRVLPTALLTTAIAAAPSLASPEPAALLPPRTAYTILLDTRPETWDQLTQYALFQQLQVLGADSPSIGGLPLLSELGLDYDTFIAPWVADTTAIALLPVEAPGTAAIAERSIVVVPIADPTIFAERFDGDLVDFISTLKQQAPAVTTYQGVDIAYWAAPTADASATEAQPVDSVAAAPEPAAPELPPSLSYDPEVAPKVWLTALLEPTDETRLSIAAGGRSSGLAIAVFSEWLVAAADPAAIRAWVDHRPPDLADSLAATAAFQQTLAHPQYDAALATLYGDLSELVKYPLTELPLPDLPFTLPLPIALPESGQLVDFPLDSTLEVLVYPQAQGLRVQGRGYYNNDQLANTAANIPTATTATLSYIPQDSYGMVNGQNLAGIWQQVTDSLEATAETRALLDQVRGFFTAFTGLDLDRDVFGWLDQGFSVFLYPTDQTPLTAIAPELRVGLGIALQTSDRATAEATLTTLDELMTAFSIAVEPTTLNGQAATSWGGLPWADDDATSFWGRTWAADDMLLLTTSVDALGDLTQLEPARALPNSLRFNASTRDFPSANQGYLFANTAPMRSLFYRLVPLGPNPADSLEFRKLVAAVQAVSGTLSFQEEYVQLDGMLLLAPAETP